VRQAIDSRSPLGQRGIATTVVVLVELVVVEVLLVDDVVVVLEAVVDVVAGWPVDVVLLLLGVEVVGGVLDVVV
jgi:hypothetical protein